MARILVIEDSTSQALNLRLILESAGHDVVIAEDGQIGLTRVESEAFDLVLSDIQMPNLNGFDMCRKIRTNPQYVTLPIILMTTLNEMQSMRRGQDVGANMYIVKPFEPEDLLRRLQKYVTPEAIAARAAGVVPGARPAVAAAAPAVDVASLKTMMQKILELSDKGLEECAGLHSGLGGVLSEVLKGIKEIAGSALEKCGVKPKAAEGAAPAAANGKILLVEPSDSLKSVLQSNLEKQGYEVQAVSSEKDGIAACKSLGKALTVLVSEATECSPELMKAVKKANPKTVQVCLIEGGDADVPILPSEVATLTRPFTVNTLVAKLKELQAT